MILTRRKIKLKDWVLFAMFAAVTVVFSQIYIPIPFTPIPVNLGNLAILLTGTLCSVGYRFGGMISVSMYILLGAFGLPVFVGFKGGIGVLSGSTGGYIVGYLLMALFCGLGYHRINKKILKITVLTASMTLCLVCGTIWFMLSTGNDLMQSLTLCVIPFIPGDIIKLIVAYILIERLKPFAMKLK